MRSLIVTALLSLALPTTAFALNICPGGNVSLTTIETIVPGEEYTAIGCNVYEEVYLNAQNTPSNASAPISIKVEDSEIYGYLQIQLPYEENALTTAPFYVTVQNNVFQNDAMIYFSRSLPPDSWITFQGNQMSGNATKYWIEDVIPIMVNIAFFQNTTFNIIDNTINFKKVAKSESPFLIYVSGSTSEGSGNATLNILRNTLTSNGTNSVNLIYINYWNTGDNSSLRIEANTLTTMNSQNQARALRLGDTISRSSSSISFSSNVVNVSTGNSEYSAVYLGLVQTDYLRIDENTITTNAFSFIQCYDSMSPRYASIRGNTFDSPNASITTPVIAIDAYYFTNATLVVASNTVTAPSVTTTDTPLLDIFNPNIEGTASIVYCGNSLPWAMNNATAEQLFSSSIIEISTFDSSACIATATTTVSPPGSSAAAIISTTFAILVCMLFTIAALL